MSLPRTREVDSPPKYKRPSTPHNDTIPEIVSERGFGLDDPELAASTEGPWSYHKGEHCPVHLGEAFGQETKYKVIHKLGNGGFGNVWLCQVVLASHPNFRSAKILVRLDGLDKDVRGGHIEGHRHARNFESHNYKGHDGSANPLPDYLLTNKLCLIDWGKAFEASSPPQKGTGIPFDYASPELVLEHKAGFASDIWALAATLFKIRVGYKLVDVCDSDPCGDLDTIIQTVGIPPQILWAKYFDKWREEYALLDYLPDDEVNQRKAGMEECKGSDGVSLLQQSIRKALEETWQEPERRPTIDEAIRHRWFEYGNEQQKRSDEAEQTESMEVDFLDKEASRIYIETPGPADLASAQTRAERPKPRGGESPESGIRKPKRKHGVHPVPYMYFALSSWVRDNSCCGREL
ncbi:hypothetical protein BDV12DRAFT_201902 [Aspergillus spectabilis]